MKTLKALGTSPTPWMTWCSNGKRVKDSRGFAVADCDYENVEDLNNARLIAAAPDLYRSLREAVVESCVSYCGEHPIHCHKKDGECFVQKWRNALAKASGEEAE